MTERDVELREEEKVDETMTLLLHVSWKTLLASGLSMLLHAQLETVTTSWLLWLLAPGAVGRHGTRSLRSL